MTVTNGTNNIGISPDGTNGWEYFLKSNIVDVKGTYQATPSLYKKAVMTKVRLNLVDGRYVDIELQDVTNQAGWNLATQAAVNTAVADIQSWL